MDKRRFLIIFLLVVALGLGFYAFYAWSKIDVPTDENKTEEIQPTTETIIKPVETVPETEVIDTQDRTVRDSNTIVKERSQEDIELNGLEDIQDLPAGLYTYSKYDYSNGIALTSTDRVTVDPFIYNGAVKCYSKFTMDENVYMSVKELTVSDTIQDMRLNLFRDLGLSDVETIEPTLRGSESQNSIIVVDDTIKTALGNGLYIVTHQPNTDTYNGTILITYNGRNFRITINAQDEETIYYYTIELTNNVIHIVN